MFSWNWAATESASVVEEAVTIAVVSRARPLTTTFIVIVAPDTTTIRNLHVTGADLSDGIDRAVNHPTTTNRPPAPGHGSAAAQVDARTKPEPQPPKRLGFRRSQTVRPS
jgi:hypothetical protein